MDSATSSLPVSISSTNDQGITIRRVKCDIQTFNYGDETLPIAKPNIGSLLFIYDMEGWKRFEQVEKRTERQIENSRDQDNRTMKPDVSVVTWVGTRKSGLNRDIIDAVRLNEVIYYDNNNVIYDDKLHSMLRLTNHGSWWRKEREKNSLFSWDRPIYSFPFVTSSSVPSSVPSSPSSPTSFKRPISEPILSPVQETSSSKISRLRSSTQHNDFKMGKLPIISQNKEMISHINSDGHDDEMGTNSETSSPESIKPQRSPKYKIPLLSISPPSSPVTKIKNTINMRSNLHFN